MTDKLRNALAERLTRFYDEARALKRNHAGEESWDFCVYSREVASRLLESRPGEEELAAIIRSYLFVALPTNDEECIQLASFLRQHIAGWVE